MTTGVDGSIVISGASSGFGRETARLLGRSGHRVVAIARRAHRLAELVAEQPDADIHPLAVDVRDRDRLRQGFDELPEKYADVSVVVNNAGLSRGFGPVQAARATHWQEMIETNVFGMLNLTELLLPRLVARGSGDVVNVGSIAARYPYLGGNVYAATKAFMHQLSANMRADLEGTGVRVCCVAPGMARTEFALVRHDGDARKAEQTYAHLTPLTARDVAEAIEWCLSRPRHVNVNLIEIMPTDQPFSLGLGRPLDRVVR
jgi:NADP-dependent 3-hydroxy acid dehydrogenase YdfG